MGQPWHTIARPCLRFLGNGQPWLKISGQWLTISRQWAAMAHICPAMAQFLGNGQALAHICSAMALIFLGNGLPWLKFLGNGSHFLGNDHPWHTFAQPWP
ncbi:hypothetical protein Acr_00g0080410, partial [Actinidia rufa]